MRMHEAKITLLNEIIQVESTSLVCFDKMHDQAQVHLDQKLSCLLIPPVWKRCATCRSSAAERSGEPAISRWYWLVASRVASSQFSVFMCHSFLVRETPYFRPL
jgi:hypothetical protein